MTANNPQRDSLIKSVGAIFLGLIILALVYNVFFTPGPMMQGYGFGMNPGGNYGMGSGMHHGAGGYGVSLGLGSILAGILIILIKLLSILLVVGLIVGLWVVVKDYMFPDGENPFAILAAGITAPKKSCPKCGTTVNNRWDFCPDCGERLNKADQPVPHQNPV